jgi:hypothetical protein
MVGRVADWRSGWVGGADGGLVGSVGVAGVGGGLVGSVGVAGRLMD